MDDISCRNKNKFRHNMKNRNLLKKSFFIIVQAMNQYTKQSQTTLSTMNQKIEGFLLQEKSVGIGQQTFRQKFVFHQNSGPDAIYVDVKTPSPSQILGMTKKQQNICLYMMAEILFKAGQILKLPISTTIVALNIAQYYYTRKNLLQLDFRDLSMGAMFLACKSQETLRRSYQIAAVFDYLFKTYEGQRNIKQLELNSPEYNYIKEKVTKTQNEILFQLGFQVYKLFDIPHRYISGLLSSFNKHKDCNLIVQHSWNFLNDIYRTKCPIHFPGQVIAATSVFMALQKLSIPLPEKPWWILMETSIHQIKWISLFVQDMLEISQNNEVNLNIVSDILQKIGKQTLKVTNVFPVPYYRKIWLEGQGLLMKKIQIQKSVETIEKLKDYRQSLSEQENQRQQHDHHKERSKKEKKKHKKKNKAHKNGERSRSKTPERKISLTKGKYQNDDETPKIKNKTHQKIQNTHGEEKSVEEQNVESKKPQAYVISTAKQSHPVKKSILLDAKSMLSKISLQIKKIEQKNEMVITSKVQEVTIAHKALQQQMVNKPVNNVKQSKVEEEVEQVSSDEQDDELLADLIKIKRKNFQKKQE